MMNSKKIVSIALVGTSVLLMSLQMASSAEFGSEIIATEADNAFYARGEVGAAWLGQDRGYWCSPGCAVPPPGRDPRITFDIDDNVGFTGNFAIGRYFTTGLRGDISIGYSGHDIDADWIAPLPGPHADIDTSVSALSGFANVFIEPLAMMGNDSGIQPFFTAGIGAASVKMDDWTRTNAAAPRPVRVFESNTDVNFAWTVGAGVSADLSNIGSLPMFLDLTYRYTDLGNISGGSNPLPGNGNSTPDEPFNLDYRTHSVAIGLRIPFGG